MDSQSIFVIFGFAALAVFAAGFWQARKLQGSGLLEKQLQDLRNDLRLSREGLSSEIQNQTERNVRFLQDTRADYQSTIGLMENRLGQLQQATGQMLDMAKELTALQNILQHPKLRGGLGEFILEELLAQVLPSDAYSLQYSFSDGQKADAVLRLQDALVAVDSKFPLENYQRMLQVQGDETERKSLRRLFMQDVRKHLDDISNKYIRPAEGTLDFALIFIPVEVVYYEAFLAPEEEVRAISEYAARKKVLAVSPQGFYAYLQIIARGLKGLRIEKAAQEILENLTQLENDFHAAMTDFEKLGTHLKNAQTAYERNLRNWTGLKEDLGAMAAFRAAQGQPPQAEACGTES